MPIRAAVPAAPISRTSTSGRKVFSVPAAAAVAGFGGFEDILKDMFGGAGRRGGGGGARQFEPDDFGDPASRDVAAEVTISLEEAAKGGSRRVHLPTGKEVEVKIPKGLGDGQQIRLKGQGLPGARGLGDALITVKIAPHPAVHPVTEPICASTCRSPSTRRCWAARSGCRRSTAPSSSRSRPARRAAAPFRLKGKGMPGRDQGDLLVTVRIVLPAHADHALEELMKNWRDQRPYDPRKNLG